MKNDTDFNSAESSTRKNHVPPEAELEDLFTSSSLQRIGEGRRRICYLIPGRNLCVKCYRSVPPRNKSIAKEIERYRFDERNNTCCQEYRYYNELRKKLPPEIFSLFPETCEQIFSPSRGWCIVETYYENCNRFTVAYRSSTEENKKRLLDEFSKVIKSLMEHSVRFYDTQNIMVGNDGVLRIVDFEPASRNFIPLDSIFPSLIKLKVRRRAKRFLAEHLNIKMDF